MCNLLKLVSALCVFNFGFSIALFSQANYFQYHSKINEAEDQLLKGNNSSAFKIYSQTFSAFDFVYPRDCLVAAQFAYRSGEKEISLGYLNRGFDWGLMPFHILRCPVFDLGDAQFFQRCKELYVKAREQYLKRVNPDVIQKVLNIRWKDQLYKSVNPTYVVTNNGNDIVLDSIQMKIMCEIIEISRKFGYPGQKVIGIVHNNILKELGKDSTLDLPNRYRNFTEKIAYKLAKEVGELNSLEWLANQIVTTALIHHSCAFQKLGKDFLLNEIKRGNMHPADYALVYTAEYCRCFAPYKQKDSALLRKVCPIEEFNGGYGIVIESDQVDSAKIDSNRKEIGLSTISHFVKLQRLAKENHIIVGFGFLEIQ